MLIDSLVSPMSTTIRQQRCKHCDNTSVVDEQYKRGYCSEKCYYQHKGQKALNLLRYNHTICASCGRWLKEIEEPPDGFSLELKGPKGQPDEQELQETIVGFQYLTPDAEIHVKEFQTETYTPVFHTTGTGCTCGNTDTSDVTTELQHIELETVLSNYINAFREFEAEGQLDQDIIPEVFIRTYLKTEDLALSIGKALHQ